MVDLDMDDMRVVDLEVVGLILGVVGEDCLRDVGVVDEDYLRKVVVVAESYLLDDPTHFEAYHWLDFDH